MPVAFTGFSAAAMFVAIDGFAKQGVDEIRAGALVMAVGAFYVRITRSRVHLREQSLVIVNPLRRLEKELERMRKDVYGD